MRVPPSLCGLLQPPSIPRRLNCAARVTLTAPRSADGSGSDIDEAAEAQGAWLNHWAQDEFGADLQQQVRRAGPGVALARRAASWQHRREPWPVS